MTAAKVDNSNRWSKARALEQSNELLWVLSLCSSSTRLSSMLRLDFGH